MSYKNKDIKDHKSFEKNVSLTREALLKNKSKWDLFLDGYKNHYNTEFSWPEYIKKCKLYYGKFDIKEFINTYGPECEQHFKRFRNKILEEKGIVKKEPQETSIPMIEFDEKILELMVNGDNLRTRMLIAFLNPQTREEKRTLRRSWRKAKKQKQTKSEWMKTYVGIPFKLGQLDPQDTKYTRDEIFEMIRDAKRRLNDLKIKRKEFATRKMDFAIETPSKAINVSNIAELSHLNKGLDDLNIFQPTKKFSLSTTDLTKDNDEQNKDSDKQNFSESNADFFKNFNLEPNLVNIENKTHKNIDPFDEEKQQKKLNTIDFLDDEDDELITIEEQTKLTSMSDECDNFVIKNVKNENFEPSFVVDENKEDDFEVIKIDDFWKKDDIVNNDANNHDLEKKNFTSEIDRSNYLKNLLKIENDINDQLNIIKNDNELIKQELYKTNQIKIEEQQKYDDLKKQKEDLARTILFESKSYKN